MSFAITVYIREGIVMAADSRLSLNTKKAVGQSITNYISVGQSDSNQKLFLTDSGVGISTVGDADIQGVPIAGLIEQFISQVVANKQLTPDKVADEIINYFNLQSIVPDTQFCVAGYEKSKQIQQVYHVVVKSKIKNMINNIDPYGAWWAGEIDIISRILNPSAEVDPANGNAIKAIHPFIQIPFNYFTLQDAIDFSVYAVRTTIDTIRFQPRPKTVGGPIDVLVIKPTEAKWIKKKGSSQEFVRKGRFGEFAHAVIECGDVGRDGAKAVAPMTDHLGLLFKPSTVPLLIFRSK